MMVLTMLVTLVGAGVFLAPNAAAADTLAAPTNLHQTGTDEYGYPVLDWNRSVDHTNFGYYEILYSPVDPAGWGATGLGWAPWHTEYDVWGYCLESGTYDVSVRFVRPDGNRSGWSNTIRIVLNTPF
jgi:hypothetical protein